MSIADGLPPLSPPIARRLIAYFQGAEGQPPDGTLTPREREVLAKLAQGMTLADIAGELHLSRPTVSDHVKNIYRKLGISSRAEAALRARSMGLT
jgi:DNA-binding NarL/FixJ family response regulator